MKVLGKLKLQQFWQKHNQAQKPLMRWLFIAENAHWNSINDVRKTFNSVDPLKHENKNYLIFNISGNKYRLIAIVEYAGQIVLVKSVMTHETYSKTNWKAKL